MVNNELILFTLKLKQEIVEDKTIREADKEYLFTLINKIRRRYT